MGFYDSFEDYSVPLEYRIGNARKLLQVLSPISAPTMFLSDSYNLSNSIHGPNKVLLLRSLRGPNLRRDEPRKRTSPATRSQFRLADGLIHQYCSPASIPGYLGLHDKIGFLGRHHSRIHCGTLEVEGRS